MLQTLPPSHHAAVIEEESKDWIRAYCTSDPAIKDDLWRMDQLTKMHWDMIATDKDVARLDIDRAKYLALAERNMLVVVTARLSQILGYFICLISPHPHYKSTLIGLEDAHFVHPDWRRYGFGTRMLEVMEEALRKRGVKLLKVRSKLHAPNTEWLEENGFKAIEVTYTKVL
jgi:GNAT superfamily N-acetyltransferase